MSRGDTRYVTGSLGRKHHDLGIRQSETWYTDIQNAYMLKDIQNVSTV